MLVITAILLTVLLAFTALVIDIGNARQERRTVQNFADAVALGGATELPDRTAAESAALQVLQENDPTASDTATYFDGCLDPERLAIASEATPCISFNDSDAPTMIRVRMPTRAVETLFGGIVGVNEVDVSAGATARIRGGDGFGGVIPIWVPAGTTSGELCLKSDAPGSGAPGCAGQQTGDFGTTGVTLWKQNCSSATQQMMRDNVANGPDHDLSIYDDPSGVNDRTGCPAPDGSTADILQTDPGNDVTGFTDGLVATDPSLFIYGAPGRLHRGTWRNLTYQDAPHTATSFSDNVVGSSGVWADLDDTPLWTFIPADTVLATRDVPLSCRRSEFVARTIETLPPSQPLGFSGIWAQVDETDWRKIRIAEQYRLCFSDYIAGVRSPGVPCAATPCGGSVFDKDDNRLGPDPVLDIQRTPRFAYVPTLGNPMGGGGSNVRPVTGFQAVYLDTIYIGQCGDRGPQGNPNSGPFDNGRCLIWTPGPWDDSYGGNASASATALTAWAFHPGMLGRDAEGNDIVRVPRGSGGGEIEPIIELIK
ncbi:MAG TPA: pilus assembly protein TadG-related protein [Vicinamibacterales bacterium]|nr:pilus assembly protein TadG-related protein [Vicinamibacterales bacterium]